MSELAVTHTSTVAADQIDHLGHMNVRHYASNARSGTEAVLAGLGWNAPGDADVFDMYTRHHHEQLLDTNLEVRSGVLGVDNRSLTIYHELSNAADGDLAATFVHRVRTDGSTPFDHLDTITLPPPGLPRSIDLSADPIGSAPTLAAVQLLDVPIRAPRHIDDADTAGSPAVLPHLVPMLIWGGTSPDGSDFELTHIGPNGESMGWATMETRVGIARLPTLGTRVQSFGATSSIADKTSQITMWAYDLDTAELLVTFEVVNLLFDIGRRRAMSIPDDMRAEMASRHHPELFK
jgi:acyl-CoA thioesterase FadM